MEPSGILLAMIRTLVIGLLCVAVFDPGAAGVAHAQELRTGPGNTSSIIRDGDVVEVFVDEKGKIYRELRYHGIIPEIRDHLGEKPPKKPKERARTTVTWVGFQQKQFYSRIFVQTNRLSRFTLHKPSPLQIVVTIPNARIRRRNDGLRPIVTSQFSASIEEIRAVRKRNDVQVLITLSKPVGYLYKQHGKYVFIDVER